MRKLLLALIVGISFTLVQGQNLSLLKPIPFDSVNYKRPEYISVDSLLIKTRSKPLQYRAFDSFLVNQNTCQDFLWEWIYSSESSDSATFMDFKERYFFIDLWYASCAPCVVSFDEMKSIDTLLKNSPVKFISVNTSEKPEEVAAAIEKYDLRYPVWQARIRFMAFRYQINSAPAFLLIDKQTRTAIYYEVGYWMDGFGPKENPYRHYNYLENFLKNLENESD